MDILVVGNPIAGRGRAGVLMHSVSLRLREMGHRVDVFRTSRRGDAVRAVSRHPGDRVMCVGGDGTVNEVVNGLNGRDTPIAVVPSGTANVLVRELRLPREIDTICEAVCKGSTVSIDACVMGETRFVLCAGIGFDAEILRDLSARRKGRMLGYVSYLHSMLKSWMRLRPARFAVEVDERIVADDAIFTVAANVRTYVAYWAMLPEADPSDGLVDIMVFRGRTKHDIMSLALSVLLRKHVERDDVLCSRGRKVRIFPCGGARAAVHVDGDVAGWLPVEITVDPGSVKVVVPEGYNDNV